MRVSRIRFIIRALALLSTASLLTTCGDDGSSSKEDRGVFGEMADVLMQAESDYLTANAEIFACAEYMEPFIAEYLSSNSSTPISASAQTSCLPEGIGGRTYTINGTPFTSVVDTTVPEYTARFRLFKLSTANQPLLNQEIGYVDYNCVIDVGTPTAAVRIARGETQVASTALSVSGLHIDGAFGDPHGRYALSFEGSAISPPSIWIQFSVSDSIEAGSLFPVWGQDLPVLEYSIRIIQPSSDCVLRGRIVADDANVVQTGQVYCNHDSQFTLLACIDSGTLDSPIFLMPSAECAAKYGDPMLITQADLRAISDSYSSLRHFWLTAANLVDICRSLVPDDK